MSEIDFNYRLYNYCVRQSGADYSMDSSWDINRPVFLDDSKPVLHGSYLAVLPPCVITAREQSGDPRFLNGLLYDIGVRFSITPKHPLPLIQHGWSNVDLAQRGENQVTWFIFPSLHTRAMMERPGYNYHFLKEFDAWTTVKSGDIGNGGVAFGPNYDLARLFTTLLNLRIPMRRVPEYLMNHRVFGQRTILRCREWYRDNFSPEDLGDFS